MSYKKIYEVSSIDFQVIRTKDAIRVIASGTVPSGRYTNPQLSPWIYVRPPQDGIYDFDFLAEEGDVPGTDVMTDITVDQVIPKQEDFRGIRIHASRNSKTLRCLVLSKAIPTGLDNLSLLKATTRNDKLVIEVSYGGGHQVHEFEAYWDGSYMESNPPQVNIFLIHNAYNDRAMALFNQEIEFDLLGLQACTIHLCIEKSRVMSLEYHSPTEVAGIDI